MRESTARRTRRASTRRATSYIHTTHYALMLHPSPSPRAQLLSRVSLPLALARKDRLVAAITRTSCSWSIGEPRSPMQPTPTERERERERERETQWLSAVSAIRRTVRASIGSVRTARSRRSEEGGRSANYGIAEQRTRTRFLLFCRLPPCRVRCECSAPSRSAAPRARYRVGAVLPDGDFLSHLL